MYRIYQKNMREKVVDLGLVEDPGRYIEMQVMLLAPAVHANGYTSHVTSSWQPKRQYDSNNRATEGPELPQAIYICMVVPFQKECALGIMDYLGNLLHFNGARKWLSFIKAGGLVQMDAVVSWFTFTRIRQTYCFQVAARLAYDHDLYKG